jgi:hypothetical protein
MEMIYCYNSNQQITESLIAIYCGLREDYVGGLFGLLSAPGGTHTAPNAHALTHSFTRSIYSFTSFFLVALPFDLRYSNMECA